MLVNPAIVVVAYNRPHSLKRLLKSLANANYPNNEIDIIISIDKADNNKSVLDIAQEFVWTFGKKIIKYQKKNLGLRKHIIECGNISLNYGSVIILEDDLYVSKNFYYYTIAALQFSYNKEYIGGISLYNHNMNVHSGEYFRSLDDGYDNYYFQFASSWGQAWTDKQWNNFIKWYRNKPEIDNRDNIPAYVLSWSEKSWLKYFIAFLVEKNQYFLYPKIGLSTNFNDAGTHVQQNSTIFQCELYFGFIKSDYNFSDIENSQAVYVT